MILAPLFPSGVEQYLPVVQLDAASHPIRLVDQHLCRSLRPRATNQVSSFDSRVSMFKFRLQHQVLSVLFQSPCIPIFYSVASSISTGHCLNCICTAHGAKWQGPPDYTFQDDHAEATPPTKPRKSPTVLPIDYCLPASYTPRSISTRGSL